MPGSILWVVEGTDTEFVGERRPTTAKEVLEAGPNWTELFSMWLRNDSQSTSAERDRWTRLAEAYKRSPHLDRALAEADVSKDQMASLDQVVANPFNEACRQILAFREEQAATARQQLAAAGHADPWYQVGPSAKESKATRRLVDLQTAKARSAQWERDAGASSPEMTEVTLGRVEAVMAAFTHDAKPRFQELYQHYANPNHATKDLPVVQQLEVAYGKLISAEGHLRQGCQYMRKHLGVGTQPKDADRWVPDDAEQAVLKAWVKYTKACTTLGRALCEATEGIVEWAVADTQKKIQADFATAHRTTASVQLGLNLTVNVLGAVAQCLALAVAGPAAPVVAGATQTATAALGVMMGLVRKTYEKYVSGEDAQNPATVFEHTGRVYKAVSGEKAARFLADGAEAASILGTVGAPALRWDAAASGSTAAKEAVPDVSQLGQFGAIAVEMNKLCNPKELKDTRDREALLEMVQQAFAHLAESTSQTTVSVLSFDPESGQSKIVVNGKHGTLTRGGRFSVTDGDAGLNASLRDWTRSTGDVFPCVVPRGDITFATERIPHFTLLTREERLPIEASDVASAIIDHEEVEGGFRCRAFASGLGLSRTRGRDCWLITFFLSHEGKAKLEKYEFKQLFRYAENSSLAICAETEETAAALTDVCRNDPSLDWLSAAQYFFKFSDDTLTLHDGHVYAGGAHLLDLGTILEHPRALQNAMATCLALEAGGSVTIDHWESMPQMEIDLLNMEGWYTAYTDYSALRDSAADDAGRWIDYRILFKGLEASPGFAVQRFHHLALSDPQINTEAFGDFDRIQELIICGSDALTDPADSALLLALFEAASARGLALTEI